MEPLPAAPGPPMELVLPDVSALVEPGVVPPLMALVLPVPPVAGVPLVLLEVEVSALGAGVVVDELDDDDVVGVGASSRLVQAPRETAATSASAAHVGRDAFIRKLLYTLFESSKGSHHHPMGTLGSPRARFVGSHR